jgi:hypothetical protein
VRTWIEEARPCYLSCNPGEKPAEIFYGKKPWSKRRCIAGPRNGRAGTIAIGIVAQKGATITALDLARTGRRMRKLAAVDALLARDERKLQCLVCRQSTSPSDSSLSTLV